MKKLVYAVFVAVLMVGCGENNAEQGKHNPQDSVLSTNAVTDVDKDLIVSFDDVKFLEPELARQIALRIEVESVGRSLSDISKKNLETRLEQQAPYNFVNGQLLFAYGKDHGITISDEEVAKHCREVAKGYNSPDLNSFLANFSPLSQALFKSMVKEEALKAKIRAFILNSVDKNVSEEEIANQYARLDRINTNGAATNAIVFAKATNVWQRIVASQLTFEEAVEDFTEDVSKERDGYWGRFTADDLAAEPELYTKVSLAAEGAVLPPIECDNALCIVKLDSKTVEDDEPVYILSRIVFRVAEIFQVPTKEELVDMILEARSEAAMEAALTPILRKTKIRYGANWNRFGRKQSNSKRKIGKKQQEGYR